MALKIIMCYILTTLIDAYNKIQNDISGKQHFDYFKQLGKEAFDSKQNVV